MWSCLILGIQVSGLLPKASISFIYSIAKARPAVDHKCIMTLHTSGPSDSESWNRIWETATFVTAMCARRGKKGLYSQVGKLHF